jgi:hypothetical protein
MGKRPAPTAKSLANLKPAQKGEVRNPNGRPKMPEDVKEALEGGSLRAAQRLVQLVDSPDERIALMASETVLSRLYGKPTQSVDAQVTTTNVQQAHLQVLIELQQKREAAMKTIEGTANLSEQKPETSMKTDGD